MTRLLLWFLPENRRAALRGEIRELVKKSYWREVKLRDKARDADRRAERAEARVVGLEQQRAVQDAALQVLFLARGQMSPLTKLGLLVDLPLTSDGRLDEVEFAGRVFDATVEAAREAEMRSQS